MKRKIIALVVCLILIFNFSVADAKEVSTQDQNWIYQMLNKSTEYQKLLENYPNTKITKIKTVYVLYETKTDVSGNVIKENKKIFDNKANMDNYEKTQNKEIQFNNSINAIGTGDTEYTYFSSMKLGISEAKITNTLFFCACTFEWLQLPPPTRLSRQLQGVFGMALNPQLTMQGSSYSGYVDYTLSWCYGTSTGSTNYVLTDTNGGISIQPTGTQGIGYSFSAPHYTGANWEVVTNMIGLINCYAYKSNNNDDYCSIYSEYADVNYTLSLSNFSVSVPLGISFGLTTNYTKYPAQGALDIR